jgi:hypothetical protein
MVVSGHRAEGGCIFRFVRYSGLSLPLSRRYGSDMGTLFYSETGTPIQIEDRTLAHLKVAITTKLRRGESFTLSWQHRSDQPRGRSTIWMHPTIPLRFVFDEPERPDLNKVWLDQLMRSANSTGGIQLVEEQPIGDQAGSTDDPADEALTV